MAVLAPAGIAPRGDGDHVTLLSDRGAEPAAGRNYGGDGGGQDDTSAQGISTQEDTSGQDVSTQDTLARDGVIW